MRGLIAHSPQSSNKNRADFSDFLGLTFPQWFVQCRVFALANEYGYTEMQCTQISRYAATIAATVKNTGCEVYQLPQRLLAKIVCGLYGRPAHSRQYANRIEGYMEDLGLVEIPKYRTNIDSPPKIRTITKKFFDLIRETGSFTTSNRSEKRVSKETENTIFNSNPIREGLKHIIEPAVRRLTRPSRATLFDHNHLRALALRGVHMDRLSRCDRQLLFHAQMALPNDYDALALFTELTRGRAAAEPRAMAFFERWKGLRAGSRTGAVIAFCGNEYLSRMSERRLSAEDRQFLYYCATISSSTGDCVRFFTDTVRLRLNGDDRAQKLFSCWGDLTRWSKPGLVRALRCSLSVIPDPAWLSCSATITPAEAEEGAARGKEEEEEERTGEVTILDSLADIMSAEEQKLLLASYLFGEPYDGQFAGILQRLRELSTSNGG